MISKAKIRFVQSLHQKKHREELGLFIAEGTKIVMDLLGSEIKLHELFATKEFIQEGNQLSASDKVTVVAQDELKKISSLSTPNQVVGVFKIPAFHFNVEDIKLQLMLALDDIRDPGNLGSIIRIADWFGISSIICSEECADVFNPKTVQATMGSIARVKVHYAALIPLMESIRDKIADAKIYGTLLEGENIYEKNLLNKGLIVIGNESRGISEKLFPFFTDKIKIPLCKFQRSFPDSLNAAAATAIICSEFRRRVFL